MIRIFISTHLTCYVSGCVELLPVRWAMDPVFPGAHKDGLHQMSTSTHGHLGTETPPCCQHNGSLYHVMSSEEELSQARRFWAPWGDTKDLWSSASDHTMMASHILILIVVLWMVVSIPSENIKHTVNIMIHWTLFY